MTRKDLGKEIGFGVSEVKLMGKSLLRYDKRSIGFSGPFTTDEIGGD